MTIAKAPYYADGSLKHFVYHEDDVAEWRDNVPFYEMLTLDGAVRGMSAARLRWYAEGGRRFEMFLTDLVDMINRTPNLYKGAISGWWMVNKRGRNYGIRLATDAELIAAGHTGGLAAHCPVCQNIELPLPSLCPVPEPCNCSREDKTACSSPTCKG
jgi:hypothetical protein